jgi:hypothetical protein
MMALSSSIDFTLTAAEIIEEARREVGIHADEEPLSAQDLVTGLRTLNRMLKAWQAEGVMCWTMTEGTLTLVASDESYVFGAGGTFTTVPLEITDIRINRGGNDLPMQRLSREDYYNLPNKTSTGYPTCFYYDRQRSGGTLYVWPAPDSTAGTLKFTYRRIIMDVDEASNDLDLPQEWYDAIIFGLAKRLGGHAGVLGSEDGKRVMVEAERSYMAVKAFDVGEGTGSLMITPAGYR